MSSKTTVKLLQQTAGLQLINPHAKWLWAGKKTLIVKDRLYAYMLDQALYVLDDKYSYGAIRLLKPIKLTSKEFEQRTTEHLISEEERTKWWSDSKSLYAYPFAWIKKFDMPRRIERPNTEHSFVRDVCFLCDSDTEMVEEKIPKEEEPAGGTFLLLEGKDGQKYKVRAELVEEIEEEEELAEKELSVEKRGDKWCVVHGHPQKPGSPTDKPKGSIIKCFPTKADAERMHKAIIIRQKTKEDADLSEEGGHKVLNIQKFPKEMMESFKKVKSEGKSRPFVLQWHITNEHSHTDLRFDVGDNVQGIALFSPPSINKKDLLTNKARSIMSTIKNSQSESWMNTGGVFELADKSSCELFLTIGTGTYTVDEIDETHLSFELTSDDGIVELAPLKEYLDKGFSVPKNISPKLKQLSGAFSFHIVDIGNERSIMLFDSIHTSKNISDDIISKIYTLSEKNCSRAEIAAAVGLSDITVWSHQKGLGFV